MPSDSVATPRLVEHLRPMRVALAVARHGSTARASAAIHLSQSAVARSIMELEKACGLPLFERATRGMVATQAGARLAARVETLLHHLASGAAEAAAATPPEARSPAVPERFPAVVSSAQIKALVAIAAQGSEAAAAASLGVTQPAVHHALQGLEPLVGARLFYRLASGTRLTPAGEALLRRVKLTLAEIKAMESDIGAWQGEVRGRVIVGVLPLSVSLFLPRAVRALAQRHPDIEVQIVDGTYESLVRQLLSADVDVIAGALRGEAGGELKEWHLFDDDLVVVARAGHPCFAQAPSSLADLLPWEWVTPLPDTPADRALQKVFAAEGLAPPARTLRASSPSLTLAFVMQADRLALASHGQALAENQGGGLCVVPVRLAATQRRIGLATRAVGQPSPDLTSFIEACQAAVTRRHSPQEDPA